MNPVAKILFVEALRSGQYVQTVWATRRIIDGVCYFCAFGVLLDVFLRQYPDRWKWSERTVDGVLDRRKCLFVRPPEFDAWTGLTPANEIELTKRNDRLHETFPQIADWVEAAL